MAAALEDVTYNLPSLQFEAALSSSEKEMLDLRWRSHALTVAACGQGSFLVAVLNDARQRILETRSPSKKKSSKLLQEAPKRDPLLVGMIGCGRLGKQLANTLLKYSDVQPGELYISTRRPETLTSLQARGVHCGFDNVKVSSIVHILFLCCLPSQLPTVAKEIRGHLNCTVYVFIGGTPLPRIYQLMDYRNVIKPDFSFRNPNKDQASGDDEYRKCIADKDMLEILRDPLCCEAICPLNSKHSSPVQTAEHWVLSVLFTFVNMCKEKGLDKEHTVELCNAVLFGVGPVEDPAEGLTVEDLEVDAKRLAQENDQPSEEFFPMFDISKVIAEETTLSVRLFEESGSLRRLFVRRFKAVFDKFRYWKGIPTNVP